MLGLKTKAPQGAPTQKAASASVLSDLIALSGTGSARWSGRDTTSLAQVGFQRNVIAYRCVQMIADAAASIPLTLCDGQGPMVDHHLCRLLTRPNPDQSGQALFEALFGHLQLHGNAYLEVVTGGQGPVALYLLRPDRVTVDLGADGWPTGYTYRTSKAKRHLRRRPDGSLPVVHIKLFNPLCDQYGQSPLRVAADAVDLHNAAVNWNKALLDNAARPSGALVYHGVEGANSLTASQFDRLKQELADTYQGPGQAGRPMVLDGGLEWKPMSLSPAEMDFLGLKNSAARDIALALGVPPMLLGIPGDNTYANYREANLSFWRQTILPLVGKVVATLNSALVPGGEVRIGFDASSVDALQPDQAAKLETLLSADVLTDAEKRLALGYPSTPEV